MTPACGADVRIWFHGLLSGGGGVARLDDGYGGSSRGVEGCIRGDHTLSSLGKCWWWRCLSEVPEMALSSPCWCISIDMLNVTPIAAQAVRDYYARMAALSLNGSYWYGLGAYALGFSQGEPVNADDLYALCAIGPRAASAIASGTDIGYVISDIEEHQASLERPRAPGYDLTFSAAKSISLAYLAHPDERTRDALALAHRLAVNNALSFLQDKAGVTRLTIEGKVSIEPGEMVFAGFTHYTNRDIEPHLHTHVLVPNVVRCEDGKWRSLHNKELYRWYMSAGAIYRASLREHMGRLTNAEWSIHSDGWRAELTGLATWRGADGAELLPAFSMRHKEAAELRERLENLSPTGTISPKTRRSVAVRTRKAKDFGQGDANIDQVRDELRTQLESVWNLGDNEWDQILGAYEDPRPGASAAGLWLRIPTHLGLYGPIPLVENADELVDYLARVLFYGSGPKEGVLSSKAYVTVQDLHASVYNLVGGFVDGDVLKETIAKLVAGEGHDPTLRLVPLVPALFVRDRHISPERVPIRYYATSGVLNSEKTVLEIASEPTMAGILGPDVVNDYLAQTLEAQREAGQYLLSTEQQDALRYLLRADTTVALLMGAQGAGKTTLFRHFTKLAQANEVTVWGLAPQGTAVQKLGDTLHITDPTAKALTIESFVWQVNAGFLKVPANTCIILDESSQVDTLELGEVLNIVRDAGAKLILVGDDRQLGSVRYGGMFATLYAKLGGARLVTTRRAANAGDRVAQASLRMGDLREALRTYDQMGRVEVADDGLALMESASAWLRNEFSLGTDSFVITNTKAEEIAANALAHEIWDEYRLAWVQGYLRTQKQHHRISNELYEQRLRRASDENPVLGVEFAGSILELHMGDLVAIRRSVKVDKTTRLFNGQRGRIVDITDKSVVLYIEDESSARHVRIPRSIINEEKNRGMFSYGWASTVFRTQSMELGMSEGSLAVADSLGALVADTPVLVRMRKRGPEHLRRVRATFLEDKGDKITVRLEDGKVATVERSRVTISQETADRIDRIGVEARDGNALVIGTEGMNLDALLVAASRARQHTNFIFRSALDTETDQGTEIRLAQADKAEVARATLMLYLARQRRGEEPDSAYLRLARERETLTLAVTTDIKMLNELHVWLNDHLRSGELEVSFDTSTRAAHQEREHLMDRLSQLEERLRGTDDPEMQTHLGTEIDHISVAVASLDRELTRMGFFDAFIGHAKGALGDSEGRVVLDARYVRDRIALVDDAIAIAEDQGAWVETPHGIEVPLPENTSREVVDMSAREVFESEEGSEEAKRAKLFSNVSYRVASDWMVIADNIYDQMMSEGLTIEAALRRIEVTDRDRGRIREAMAAIAIGRLNPTPVGHQLTLRALREESLEANVDPALVALVDRVSESVAQIREREAEAKSWDQIAPDFSDDDASDDYYGDEDWNGIDIGDDEVPTANIPSVDEYIDDIGWDVADWVPPEAIRDSGADTTAATNHSARESMPQIQWRKARRPKPSVEEHSETAVVVPTNEVSSLAQPDSKAAPQGVKRDWVKGFFYRADDGCWAVDYARRERVISHMYRNSVKHHLTSARINEIVDITKPREIVPGETYTPSARLLAKLAKAEAEERARDEERKASRHDYSPYPSLPGSSKGDSTRGGRGYGYRPN